METHKVEKLRTADIGFNSDEVIQKDSGKPCKLGRLCPPQTDLLLVDGFETSILPKAKHT